MKKLSLSLVGAGLILASSLGVASAQVTSSNQSAAKMDDSRWVVSWDPLMSVAQMLSGGVAYRTTPASLVGVTAAYYLGQSKDRGAYSVQLNYGMALDGDIMSDGWIAKVGLGYGKYYDKDKYGPSGQGQEVGGFIASGLMTYQWMWDTGFNLQLGLGLLVGASQHDLKANSGILPYGEFRFGYAF